MHSHLLVFDECYPPRQVHGVKRIDDLIAEFAELERNHTLDNQPADV